MKTCAPALALSLGACVSISPNAQEAIDDRTKADMRSYLAENWEWYEPRLRRTRQLPAGKLEFVDLRDIRCEPSAGALLCDYQIIVRTEGGELTAISDGSTFAYHDGTFGEVIIVG